MILHFINFNLLFNIKEKTMFKIEVKTRYVVNGKEYDSIEDTREIKKPIESYNPQHLEQKKLNFLQIPVYDVDISNLIFCPQIFRDVNLNDIVEIKEKLSNNKYCFVLPTYSEIKKMDVLDFFPSKIEKSEYWTSTRFLYNTYISYDYNRKIFNDIYPQYRRDAFFLIKENREGNWFRDPPIPGSIDEILYLKEKQKSNFVY